MEVAGAEKGMLAADRAIRSLEALRKIDALDYEMLLELLTGNFSAKEWGQAKECSPSDVCNRKALAMYRFSSEYFSVLELIQPELPKQALRARRFTAGVADEHTALEALRRTHKTATGIGAFRDAYQDGAEQSLLWLAMGDALGPVRAEEMETGWRRVLGLPPRLESQPQTRMHRRIGLGFTARHPAEPGLPATDLSTPDEELDARWIQELPLLHEARPLHGHISFDTLTAHTFDELTAAQARQITEHLLSCDGAKPCLAFYRALLFGVDAARQLGEFSEPYPA